MRNKIIAVNAVIVLIVGLLAFAIVQTQLVARDEQHRQLKRQRAARRRRAPPRSSSSTASGPSAGSRRRPPIRTPARLSRQGHRRRPRRRGAAALRPDRERGRRRARRQAVDRRRSSTSSGKIVGRNGSDLNRGDDVAATYPAFKEAIAKALAGLRRLDRHEARRPVHRVVRRRSATTRNRQA